MEKTWNVGILIFDDVEVLDFAGPFEVFSRTRRTPGPASRRSEESAPFRVFTVAQRRGPVLATGGLKVEAKYGFAECPRVDILVVPGGFGTRSLLGNHEVLDWIRSTDRETVRTTSVCSGSLLLARAGLLKKRKATTHWGVLDFLLEIEPELQLCPEARYVDDGIISSAGVASGMDMAFYVVQLLCGRQVADETAAYIEYRRT